MNQDPKINLNISKKKSSNIKNPSKVRDKTKDNYSLITNSINSSNSILINKTNAKIELNKKKTRSNLRSISHSTKCIMKIKEKEKEKSHQNEHTIMTKKMNSFNKDNNSITNNSKKEPRDNYRNKNKKHNQINTRDIFISKNHNFDVNNHSFNYCVKSQNTTNNSLKNIDSSCHSDFYLVDNNSKIPKYKNMYSNDNIKNLPFFYSIKRGGSITCKISYSNSNDYSSVLSNGIKESTNIDLAKKILQLSPRNWIEELKENLSLLENNRSFSIDNDILNNFIKGRLSIHEHFNWLLWAVSFIFKNKIVENRNVTRNKEPVDNDKKSSPVPCDNEYSEKRYRKNAAEMLDFKNIDKWKKGFDFNGVYFRLFDKIENMKEIKIIKREIKTLNLLFLDYIQLIDNIPINIKNINNNKSLLSNNIIFPLISLVDIMNYYLLGSMIVDLPLEDYYDFELNNSINFFKSSPLFMNISEKNLLLLNNGKYLLVNVSKDLHPTLLPKEGENDLDNSTNNNANNKYVYLKYPLITNQINSDDNYFTKSSFLIYLNYFVNYLSSNKYITDINSLEYVMNKFGINKCFYLFLLSKIRFNNSCDIETNNNVVSIIKIYILVKFITKIKLNNSINTDNSSNYIENLSQMILYILSPRSPFIKNHNDYFIKKLIEQCTIYLDNYKQLCSKLFTNDINSLYTPSELLKSFISAARNNPLIFLRQIENKFHILFNHEIKYRSSICLENFVKYFRVSDIIEKEPEIFTFINGDELSFYIIIKKIYIYQTTNLNYYKKKGSKMCKNISSDNMELYNGCKYNIDNLSILNRSIVQPRNSNFRILNSSKDRQNIKPLSSIHVNINNLNENITNCNTNVNTNGNSNNNCNNITTDNVNLSKVNSGSSKSSQISNYHPNNTNCSKGDYLPESLSSVENIAAASSSSKDMFEFNYGDESDGSINCSYTESGYVTNITKQRNTTNLNSTKYNLNSKNNKSNNIAKAIGIFPNSNSASNNNIITASSCSSAEVLSSKKYCYGQENRNQYWAILFNNYHIKCPPNLHKVITQNSKSSSVIYKYLSMYYSFFPFNNHMMGNKNSYKEKKNNNSSEINVTSILTEMKLILEPILINLISVNTRSSYILILFYIYYFLNFYFVETNQIKLCQEIISKINDINDNKILYKENNYTLIINLLNGLLNEKIDFLKTEKYYSKSVILSLIQYGEPRGRNNDGNNIMLFPVWKTGRNCMILDNNEILNENYKELYHCLFYLYDNKRSNKVKLNEVKDENLVDKSIQNDLFRNIEYCKITFRKNNKLVKKYENVNCFFNSNHFNISNSSTNSNNNLNVNQIKQSQIDETFLNFDEDEMLERPSKADNNFFDEFANVNESINNEVVTVNNSTYNRKYQYNNFQHDSNIYSMNSATNSNYNNHIFYNCNNNTNYTENINNINNLNINSSNNSNINTNNNANTNSNNIPTLNPDCTFDAYFNENTTYPDIIFPSMSDKKATTASGFFMGEKFFIYFIKAVFALLNFSQSNFIYTKEYLQEQIFNETKTSISNSSNNTPAQKSQKSNTSINKILSETLYYKKYCQSYILVSFGNNSHCETSHKGYKFLTLPRVIYHLKNKEIISVKSGWEHSIAQDSEGMLYSWGNNSSCQCAFESTCTNNGNIITPKNIYELNDKNIVEISCGNEHTLALTIRGEVYSWGSINDGVLGREIKNRNSGITGIAKPQLIEYFIKNKIRITRICSGSIHNLCLDDKSNIYSFGCSKGGQLGIDENKLISLYKSNNNSSLDTSSASSNSLVKKEKDNNFCIYEPQLIESLKGINIEKISSGEAHNVVLSKEGKCYVWGFGSNGQLGLGFCEDSFPTGTGMLKSRLMTPTILNYFEKDKNFINKVFCGKTFTIFVNKKEELFSTGVNDLNQCGIDNESLIHPHFCYDISTPIKIEMFTRMKIINVSCGESHVLAITEDSLNKILFSWGSNRFGQLGQGIQTKKSLPKIVNYFLHYNNSEVFQVSCGAFHSLALLKNKEYYNVHEDERYIFDCIDKHSRNRK